MAKSDAVKGLAGVVDALVGAAGNAVDEARKTLDEVDKYVAKGAVALTNLVDVLERFTEPDTAEPVDNDNPSPSHQFIFSDLVNQGFKAEYLKTLDINKLINLFNTTQVKRADNAWDTVTDDVEATGPVVSRQQKIDYILSKPANYNTREWLNKMMSDKEIDDLYNFYKTRYGD